MREWQTGQLGDYITLQRGFDITKATQKDGEIPVVSSGGISSFHNTAMAAGPGVVIGRKGTLGSAYFLEGDYWPHDTTLWVRDFGVNSPKFVYYFFLGLDVSWLDAGSVNPTLNRNHLHKLLVTWPPFQEQRAIAEVLGALDDKIGANSQLAQLARQKAVLHISQMPLSAKLEDIADLHKRTTVPERMEVDLVRHFSLPAFDAGKGAELVDPKEIKSSKFLIEEPSVLVSKLNPRFPRVWDIPTLAAEPSVASTEFLVLHPLHEESVEVLWAILSRQSFSAELASNVAGTSGSHQRVKPATVMAAAVVNPRELQSRLKELIKSHLQIAASHHQESSTLEELRDALLPQLMSGKLRVRDAEQIVSNAV